MDQIERWDKTAGERNNVDCPQTVKGYNKSMGGVDLADMLIALYQISVKTKRWYINVFWHLVNIAKVNGWILYKGHRVQLSIPQKEEKTLLHFSFQLAESFIKESKTVTSSSRARPKKEKVMLERTFPFQNIPLFSFAAVVIPCHDVRYDEVGHWPKVNNNKSRCHKCRMVCKKFNIYLCLLEDRNYFKLYHT